MIALNSGSQIVLVRPVAILNDIKAAKDEHSNFDSFDWSAIDFC